MRENATMRKDRYEKKLLTRHDDVEMFYLSMAKIARSLPKSKEAKLRMEVCNKVSEAELAHLSEVETLQKQNLTSNSPILTNITQQPAYEYISEESFFSTRL